MRALHNFFLKIKQLVCFPTWRIHAGLRFFLYTGFSIFLSILLIIGFSHHSFQVGKVSSETFRSPFTVTDVQATEEARLRAEQSVDLQYVVDSHKTYAQLERIDKLFEKIKFAVSSMTGTERINAIGDILKDFNFLDSTNEENERELARTISLVSVDKIMELRFYISNLVGEILREGLLPTDVKQQVADLPDLLSQKYPNLDYNSFWIVGKLVKQSLVSNKEYDQAKTQVQKDSARKSVSPIHIISGQVIIAKGEVFTSDHLRKLRYLGFSVDDSLSRTVLSKLGIIIFAFLMVMLLSGYIRRFVPSVENDNRNLTLLLFILLLNCLLIKILAILASETEDLYSLGFAAPVSFATILVTILLDVRLGFIISALSSLVVGFCFNIGINFPFDLRYGLVALIIGIVSSYTVAGLKHRGHILKAGLISSLASWVPILAIVCMMFPEEDLWIILVRELSFGLAGGILGSVLALGFLPFLEMLFDVLSPMRLAELCNPNQPLLRQLLLKAPGTYHHSIMVANLAELAAIAIGANGLLARAGAYYHDVGKLKRSHFFIENQTLGSPNAHESISPYLSRSIIQAHVWEGVAILKEHDFPEQIIDIAAQHHGTTLLRFFYYKALQQAKDNEIVWEASFRYPGPKALTKEAAIIGIADCVEAAIRSMTKNITPARLESLVRKIVHERLLDGQFDSCDLTLKELDKIVLAMISSLQFVFHTRMEYPKLINTKDIKNHR